GSSSGARHPILLYFHHNEHMGFLIRGKQITTVRGQGEIARYLAAGGGKANNRQASILCRAECDDAVMPTIGGIHKLAIPGHLDFCTQIVSCKVIRKRRDRLPTLQLTCCLIE